MPAMVGNCDHLDDGCLDTIDERVRKSTDGCQPQVAMPDLASQRCGLYEREGSIDRIQKPARCCRAPVDVPRMRRSNVVCGFHPQTKRQHLERLQLVAERCPVD